MEKYLCLIFVDEWSPRIYSIHTVALLYRFVQQVFVNKLLVDGGDEERVSTALSHHPQYTNVVGVLQRDKVLQHCKVRIHHHIKSIEPATGIPVSGPAEPVGQTRQLPHQHFCRVYS